MRYVVKKMIEGKNVVARMIKTGGKMPLVHKGMEYAFAILCKTCYNIDI